MAEAEIEAETEAEAIVKTIVQGRQEARGAQKQLQRRKLCKGPENITQWVGEDENRDTQWV